MSSYAVAFLLLAILSFGVCATVPRLRRFKVAAVVAPLAFGFCSIAAASVIILGDHLVEDRFHLSLFSQLTGTRGAIVTGFMYLIYFLSGIFGTRMAIALTTRARKSG